MVKKISIIILSLLMVAIAATAIGLGLAYSGADGDTSQDTEQGGSSSTGGSSSGDGTTDDNPGTDDGSNGGGSDNGSGSNNGGTNNGGTNNGGGSNNGGSTSGGNTQKPQPHVCSYKLVKTVAADCVNGGYEEYACSCGKSEQRNKVKELGHDYKETVYKATCLADWYMTKECTRCKDSEVVTVENSKVPCEYEWTQTLAPTCTADGSQSGVCKWCSGKTTKKIDSLGHDHTDYTPNNDATCTKDGTETAVCSRCGVEDSRTLTGSSLGHNFGTYKANNDATCTSDATKTATCSRCGDKDTVTVTGTKLPHSFGAYTPNNDANCINAGTKSATCTSCGAIDTVSDPNAAPGTHSYGNWVITVEGTCKTEGVRTKTCYICGDKESENTGYAQHKLNGNNCTVCGGVFDANTFYLNFKNSGGQAAAFGTVTLEFTYLDSNGNDMSCEIYIVQTYMLNGRQIVNRTKVRSATQLSTDWYKECCFGDFTLYSLEEGCNVDFRSCWMDYDVHLNDNWLTFIIGGSGQSENGNSYTFEQRYNVDL